MKKFWIDIEYKDGSSFGFQVELEGNEATIRAELQMITRGTLMASCAYRSICYNSDGLDVCSYIKKYE